MNEQPASPLLQAKLARKLAQQLPSHVGRRGSSKSSEDTRKLPLTLCHSRHHDPP